MKKSNSPTIYSPESRLHHPLIFFSEMARDLISSRELAWRIFIRNISAKYRQTLLGYFWAFLPPLFTTATFVFLNSQHIFEIKQTEVPYPVFVLVGTLLWQLFVDSLSKPITIVNQSKSFLAKINFPRESLILAGIYEVIFDFAIRLILFIFIFLWFKIPPPQSLIFTPIGLFSLLLLGITIGIYLVPIGILYQDITNGLHFVCAMWLFLTPVVYPLPENGLARYLSTLNPVTPLLVTTRNLFIGGDFTQIEGFLAVVSISAAFLFFGWVLYRLALPHLIERISS